VGQSHGAVGHEGLEDVDDGLGELVRGHRLSLSALPAPTRTGFTVRRAGL
jgi:hypothetical protein